MNYSSLNFSGTSLPAKSVVSSLPIHGTNSDVTEAFYRPTPSFL